MIMIFKKIYYLIFFIVLFTAVYFFIRYPSKEEQRNANILFQNIVNSKIDKLSIVIHDHKGYSYLLIKDKQIIEEFLDALKNDTYIPSEPAGHHMYRFVITLHEKERSYLILLRSDSTDVNINSVEIILFDIYNIDILNLYYKSRLENKEFSSAFSQLYGNGKHHLRNNQLYNVINKYIKGRGLKYNMTLKKWTKN
jgi:hypothetical protein